MPPLGGGGSRRNIAMMFGIKKIEWCGYPMVKTYDDMFIRFDTTHECDRHTDTQTDKQTPHVGIGRAYAQHSAAKKPQMQKFTQH